MSQPNFPRQLGCIVCSHVFDGSRPVLLIAHDRDDSWQFLCGGSDHGTDETAEDYHWVGVGHLLNRDPMLEAMSALPKGYEAERPSISDDWATSQIP